MKKCRHCSKALVGRQISFCSSSCAKKAWAIRNRRRFTYVCVYCGKEFSKSKRPDEKAKLLYCSRKCANRVTCLPRIKKKTRRSKYGYISVWKPDHPRAHSGRVMEHVLVMERILERLLRKGEIVHHINYLEWDNRPDNLYLCKSNSEHNLIHRKTRYLMKDFITERRLNERLTHYIRTRCDMFDR